jgi:hypothetical protein
MAFSIGVPICKKLLFLSEFVTFHYGCTKRTLVGQKLISPLPAPYQDHSADPYRVLREGTKAYIITFFGPLAGQKMYYKTNC